MKFEYLPETDLSDFRATFLNNIPSLPSQDKKFNPDKSQELRLWSENVAIQSGKDYPNYSYHFFKPNDVVELIHDFSYRNYDIFLLKPENIKSDSFSFVFSFLSVELAFGNPQLKDDLAQLRLQLIDIYQRNGFLKDIDRSKSDLNEKIFSPDFLSSLDDEDFDYNLEDVDISALLDDFTTEEFREMQRELPAEFDKLADKEYSEKTATKIRRLAKKMAARAKATYKHYDYKELSQIFTANFTQYFVDTSYRLFLIAPDKLTANSFADLYLGAAAQNYAEIPVVVDEFLKLAQQIVTQYQEHGYLKMSKEEENKLFQYLGTELLAIENRDNWFNSDDFEGKSYSELMLGLLIVSQFIVSMNLDDLKALYLLTNDVEKVLISDIFPWSQTEDFQELLDLWLELFRHNPNRFINTKKLSTAFDIWDKLIEQKQVDFPKNYKGIFISEINGLKNPATHKEFDDFLLLENDNLTIRKRNGSNEFEVFPPAFLQFLLRDFKGTPKPASKWRQQTLDNYQTLIQDFSCEFLKNTTADYIFLENIETLLNNFITSFYADYRMSLSQITAGAVSGKMYDLYVDNPNEDFETSLIAPAFISEFFNWLGIKGKIKNADAIKNKIEGVSYYICDANYKAFILNNYKLEKKKEI